MEPCARAAELHVLLFDALQEGLDDERRGQEELRGLEVEGAQQEAAEGPAAEVHEVHGPLASIRLELGVPDLDLEGIPRFNRYSYMPYIHIASFEQSPVEIQQKFNIKL